MTESAAMNIYSILIIFLITATASAQSPITWDTPMNVAVSHFGNLHPRIVVDRAGNPLIIWGRASDQSVYFARWDGTQFTAPVKLNPSWLTIATASWMGPDIAAHGDTIYVVMKRTPEASDTNHIFIVRSLDGGRTFSPPARVDFIGDSISRFPTVAVDNAGNPVVGFMKFNPAFGDARWVVTASSDPGNTFSTDVKASGWSGKLSKVCDCCPGCIIVSGNTVAMLYRDNLNNMRDSWIGVSSNGGSLFSSGWNIDRNAWNISSCPATGPDGVILGDSLHSVFMSAAGGSGRVYRSVTSLNNAPSLPAQLVSGNIPGLSSQNYPRIDNHGSAAAVVWAQRVNGSDQVPLLFTRDIHAGFSEPYEVVATNNIPNADVALSDGKLFVVWQDDASGTVTFRTGSFATVSAVDKLPQDLSFSLYPNPVSSSMHFRSVQTARNRSMIITNVIGQTVFQAQIQDTEHTVDVSAWRTGLYFLTVFNRNARIESGKFLIAR